MDAVLGDIKLESIPVADATPQAVQKQEKKSKDKKKKKDKESKKDKKRRHSEVNGEGEMVEKNIPGVVDISCAFGRMVNFYPEITCGVYST